MEGGLWLLVFFCGGALGGSFHGGMPVVQVYPSLTIESGMRGLIWRWTRLLGGGRCRYPSHGIPQNWLRIRDYFCCVFLKKCQPL